MQSPSSFLPSFDQSQPAFVPSFDPSRPVSLPTFDPTRPLSLPTFDQTRPTTTPAQSQQLLTWLSSISQPPQRVPEPMLATQPAEVHIGTPPTRDRLVTDDESRYGTPQSPTNLDNLEIALNQANAGPVACASVQVPVTALECPVCLQTFVSPLVLGRCGHSVCDHCLSEIRNAGTHWRCPVCRAPFEYHDVHPNYALQVVLGEHARIQATAEAREAHTRAVASSAGTPALSNDDRRNQQRLDQTRLLSSMFRSGGTFPWWPSEEQTVLLARTSLQDGRVGAIVDIGAYGSLAGDAWVREQAQRAVQAGHQPQQRKMKQPISVSGVGKGSQTVDWEVTLPVAITHLDEGTKLDDFLTPVIPNSPVPGLLGLRSVQSKRGIIDTFSDPPKMYFCGPGGYEIKLSPGSSTLPLYAAPSGHLILPMSEFSRVDGTDGNREKALQPQPSDLHLPTSIKPTTTDNDDESRAPPLDEQLVPPTYD